MTQAMAGRKPEMSHLEEHRTPLLRFAMLQLRDGAAAEDVVQETFVAAVAALHKFEGRSSLRTWLTRILLNKIADHRRASGREVSLDEGEDEDGESIEAFFRANGRYAEVPQLWQNPDEALVESRFYDVLELCLQGLSARARRVFLLRELMGLAIDEICKEVGISESNCSVLMHRSRIRLRACLEQRWFAGERRPREGSP